MDTIDLPSRGINRYSSSSALLQINDRYDISYRPEQNPASEPNDLNPMETFEDAMLSTDPPAAVPASTTVAKPLKKKRSFLKETVKAAERFLSIAKNARKKSSQSQLPTVFEEEVEVELKAEEEIPSILPSTPEGKSIRAPSSIIIGTDSFSDEHGQVVSREPADPFVRSGVASQRSYGSNENQGPSTPKAGRGESDDGSVEVPEPLRIRRSDGVAVVVEEDPFVDYEDAPSPPVSPIAVHIEQLIEEYPAMTDALSGLLVTVYQHEEDERACIASERELANQALVDCMRRNDQLEDLLLGSGLSGHVI